MAETLVAEGHHVRSVAERPGRGRTPDLDVCGTGVEVKSWASLDGRPRRVPTRGSIVNKLVGAHGQGEVVVLYACGSGLSAGTALRGMADYARRQRAGELRAVRILGDGFDLAWVRDRIVERVPGAGAAREPASPAGREPAGTGARPAREPRRRLSAPEAALGW